MKITKSVLSYIFVLALLFHLAINVIDVYNVLKDPASYHFGSVAMMGDFSGEIRYKSESTYLTLSAIESIISLCGILCFLIIKNKNAIFLISAVAVVLLYTPAIWHLLFPLNL